MITDSKNNTRSGTQVYEFAYFITILIIVFCMSVLVYPVKNDLLHIKKLSFQLKSPARVDNIVKPDVSTEPIDIFVIIRLADKPEIPVRLPRKHYFFNNKNLSESDALYLYLLELSKVFDRLSKEDQLGNNRLDILSKSIEDFAIITHRLNNYKDNNIISGLSTDDPQFSQKINNYIKTINHTLSQLKDDKYSLAPFYNNITDVVQVTYAKNLKTALSSIQSDQSLPSDAIILADIILKNISRVSNNISISISTEEYNNSRSLLKGLLLNSNLEESTKEALANAMYTPLPDGAKANIFINTLLTILKNNDGYLNNTSKRNKEMLLKALQSIEFGLEKPSGDLIEGDIASQYRYIQAQQALSN